MATAFNGASNVAQGGGLAALSDEGWKSMQETVGFYKENAKMLKKTFEELGFKVYGAVDAPYVCGLTLTEETRGKCSRKF